MMKPILNPVQSETMTAQEYLILERAAVREQKGKHEFFNQKRKLMAGRTFEHNQITSNLTFALKMRINTKDLDMEAVSSDLRIPCYTKEKDYFYPDLVLIEGKPVFEDSLFDIVSNPALLGEVTSSSTEAYDRYGKFGAYRLIKSVQEYILVSQYEPLVEHFYKTPDGIWAIGEALIGMDKILIFKYLPFEIPLAEIYKKVDFKPKV